MANESATHVRVQQWSKIVNKYCQHGGEQIRFECVIFLFSICIYLYLHFCILNELFHTICGSLPMSGNLYGSMTFDYTPNNHSGYGQIHNQFIQLLYFVPSCCCRWPHSCCRNSSKSPPNCTPVDRKSVV